MTMRCCISILIGTLPALLATLSFAGRIFWRTESGAIVCYDLREK